MNVLITLRAKKEKAIFQCPRDYLEFLRILTEAKKRYALFLYAFCLMPDYCKIVAGFIKGNELREFIRYLNRKYEDHKFIVYADKGSFFRNEAPVFLGLSYDLLKTVKKIENEPVIAGIVRSPVLYPFSSAYHRSRQVEILEEAV